MPQPPVGHSSSIGSSSSFTSSKSSLLAPQNDEVSSQSDIADFHSMPRGDPYDIAASPSSKASPPLAPSVSATQMLKRAFVKRRRPSQDASVMLSSGDEHWSSSVASSAPVSPSTPLSPTSKQSKLAKHLFSSRRHDPQLDYNLSPPPVPPKPPRIQFPPAQVITAPPRGSIMVTSPSINAAIEYMRTEEEEQQRAATTTMEFQRREIGDVSRTLDERKEQWRRSDSTMGSGHTVRPTADSSSKRVSAYLASSSDRDMDLAEFLAGTPPPETPRQDSYGTDPLLGKASKRRSLSLNTHIPYSHSISPAPSFNHSSYSTSPAAEVAHNADYPSFPSAPLQPLYTNGNFPSLSSSGVSIFKPNLRDRLVAWTGGGNLTRSHSPTPSLVGSAFTSSPALVPASSHSFQPISNSRTQLVFDGGHSDVQPIAAVRQLQGGRVRSPSNSSLSSAGGFRQAASGALGLGKRAYEKVGRVLGSSGNGSGSGSDTPSHRHPSPVSIPSYSHHHHSSVAGPSAFNRRTPGSHSGMWTSGSQPGSQLGSQSGSRSSHERDSNLDGRETPLNMNASTMPSSLGRLIRPPRNLNGGIVFKRELWECVRDTRVIDPDAQDELAQRMIPALVYRCFQHLHRWGLDEEGLFRIAGRPKHIARLRSDFDSGADYNIMECSPSDLDPHAVASVFKAYLRELPESILTRSLAPAFDSAITTENSMASPLTSTGIVAKAMGQAGLPGLPSGVRALPTPMPMPMLRKPPSLSTFTLPTSSSLRAPSNALIETLSELVSRLPRENYDLLLTVVELIKATAAQSNVTKMPLSNLLLIFCPSLGMTPGLLRAFCDSTHLWEKAALLRDIQNERAADEHDRDSMASDSSSDLEYEEEGDLLLNTNVSKGKGRDMHIEDIRQEDKDDDGLEVAEPSTDEDVVLVPRGPKSKKSNSPRLSRSLTPVHQIPLPSSASVFSSSLPSSPQQSDTSLASSDEKASPSSKKAIPITPVQASVRMAAKWGTADYDKELPASPQSPLAVQTDSSSHSTMLNAPLVRTYGASDSQLERTQNPRSVTLPTPSAMASKSAPSVIFPSYGTAPSTPTSLRKYGPALSLGRSTQRSEDENATPPPTPVTPSKHVPRRPSMNLLFNTKRSASPISHIRTLTISSPISPSSLQDRESTPSPRTVTESSPPVLSLATVDTDLSSGLGWEEVFGENRSQGVVPPQPRTTTLSQPSLQTPSWSISVPPSPSRRPGSEHLLSSGGFFSPNGPPTVLPSAVAVLESGNAADTIQAIGTASKENPTKAFSIRSASPVESNVGVYREDISSSGDDSPPLSSPKEPFSPPLRINLPLSGTSLEDDDWASVVLLAAGKPDAFDS